jgi:hypothetical protein
VGVAPVTGPDPWSCDDPVGCGTWDQLEINPRSNSPGQLVNLSFQPGRERKLASRGGGWALGSQAAAVKHILLESSGLQA